MCMSMKMIVYINVNQHVLGSIIGEISKGDICRIVCLTNPSNDQLVKDDGAQIFYSIRSQTKPIGIGVNCENPSQSLPHNTAPMTRTYDWALIPLVGPCALLIHPTTNW